MIVTTEAGNIAKLKLLEKPIDEYTDDELAAWLDTTIRPERSKQKTKGPKTQTKVSRAKTTKPLDEDDIA